MDCVRQTLQWDIRSHHQRAQGIPTFSVLLDGVRFRFALDLAAKTIEVVSCALEHAVQAVGAPAADAPEEPHPVEPASKQPC